MHLEDFKQLQNCINNEAADGEGKIKAISAEAPQKLFLAAAPAQFSPGLQWTLLPTLPYNNNNIQSSKQELSEFTF